MQNGQAKIIRMRERKREPNLNNSIFLEKLSRSHKAYGISLFCLHSFSMETTRHKEIICMKSLYTLKLNTPHSNTKARSEKFYEYQAIHTKMHTNMKSEKINHKHTEFTSYSTQFTHILPIFVVVVIFSVLFGISLCRIFIRFVNITL